MNDLLTLRSQSTVMHNQARVASALMLLSLSLSICDWAQSAKPADAPSPAATVTDQTKEAIIVERDITKVVFESDGTGTREVTTAFRVLSQAGVQAFAVLTFRYTSANEAVGFDYVRVRKPDGTVIVTPDYNIQDMPADVTRSAPMYSDIHEKQVTVKALGVGDVLEYLVRYRTVKPQVAGQFWFEYSFNKDYIAKDQQLEISVPRDKYVKIACPGFQPQIKDSGDRRIYTWKSSNLERNDTDAQIPKRESPKPSVQITTFRSWEEVGRWYDTLQRTQLTVTPAIQVKANELTKGLTNDEDRIRAIYNFVSTHYHYVSLSFGIGRYQPHPAEDVLENEYGDCKDKHTLLAALLKAAGYEAWPALINAQRKIDPEVPSPGQFNHVITVVSRNSTLIWLDTTAEVAPFGLILANLRDKQALVIPTNKAPSLVKTSADPPFAGSQTFTAEGKLSPDGTLTAHIEQTVRGDNEVYYRLAFRSVSMAQWKGMGWWISYTSGFKGEVTDVTASAPDATDKPFQFAYDYMQKSYGDWGNHRIIGFTPRFSIERYAVLEEEPGEPVWLGAPGEIVYSSKIQLPSGYTPTIPAEVNLNEDFAAYYSSYSFKDGVLTERRRLTIKKSEVTLNSWETYKKFCAAVSDDGDKWIGVIGEDAYSMFQQGYIALQSHDLVKAEAWFRRVLKIDPKYSDAALILSQLLTGEQKYSEGIAVLEKAIDLAPDNSALQYQLGYTYLQNGQREKGLPLLEKVLATETRSNRFNDVAYSLANKNVSLDLAKQYGDKALQQVEVASLRTDTEEEALKNTASLGATWDTLGWIYFRLGKYDRALPFLRAAWLLSQQPVVGDHLAQLYERVGKRQEAVRILRLAFAAGPPGDEWNEIRDHYQRLVGKGAEPGVFTIDRRPDGTFTPSPAEQLSRMRTIKVSTAGAAHEFGTATFSIVFSPGKVENVTYVSGAEGLKSMASRMSTAKFNVEFPDAGPVRMTRRGILSCGSLGCDFVLLLPDRTSVHAAD